MQNDKYVNYYIETLTSTLTDCVVRNVSMQASARVNDEILKEQVETIQELQNGINELKKVSNNSIENLETEKNTLIDQLQKENKKLSQEVNELKTIRLQFETVKGEVKHVETFRNELIKEREMHQTTRSELQSRVNHITNEFNDKIDKMIKDHNNKLDQLSNKHKKQVQELNEQIDYLKLTPAKRKKYDLEHNKSVQVEETTEDSVKDGGVF